MFLDSQTSEVYWTSLLDSNIHDISVVIVSEYSSQMWSCVHLTISPWLLGRSVQHTVNLTKVYAGALEQGQKSTSPHNQYYEGIKLFSPSSLVQWGGSVFQSWNP